MDETRVSVIAPLYVNDELVQLNGTRVDIRGAHVRPFPGVTVLGNMLAAITPMPASCDIFHATWYPARPRIPKGGRFIVTVHDMIAERYTDQVRGGKVQAALKARAVAMADMVFCVSRNTRADLINILGVPEEKIRITHSASPVSHAGPRLVDPDAPAILYVGHRGGYKNFKALAEAFLASARIRAHFRLACFGGGAFTEEERALFAGLPAHGAGSVTQTGGNDDALILAYRSARLLVCPSLYEGFGLTPLEAMSCGCPALVAPCGSLPEVGGDAVAYCDDTSAEAIRVAMEQLLFDDRELANLSTRGYERAPVFNWPETSARVLSAYRELTSGG